jgi:hypothetical protein
MCAQLLALAAVALALLAFFAMELLLACRDIAFKVIMCDCYSEEMSRSAVVCYCTPWFRHSRSLRNDLAQAKFAASGRALPVNQPLL